MNVLSLFLKSSLANRLGWSIVHSLWQIALVAAVFALAIVAMRRSSARARYVCGCVALAVMLVLPIATFAVLQPANSPSQTALADVPVLPPRSIMILPDPSDPTHPQPALPTLPRAPAAADPTTLPSIPAAPVVAPSAIDTQPRPSISWKARLQSALPMLSVAWLCGVALLSLRPLLGLWTVRTLMRRGLSPLPEDIRQVGNRLARRLGIRVAVDFAQSALVRVPTVVGYLRPIVLLPAAALTGLTGEQLELVLAHELAHVRRHDYLVNLLQTVVEALLFYHPAVWWVSSFVRSERENCCDDMAVAECGNRGTYVRALWTMEHQRAAASPALAASGGSLLARVRRLVSDAPPRPAFAGASAWAGASLVLTIGLAIMVVAAGAQERPKEKDKDNLEKQPAAAGWTIKLLDSDGKPNRSTSLVAAAHGYAPEKLKGHYWPDKEGVVPIEGREAGPQLFVANYQWTTPTFIEFTAPDGVPKTVQLKPRDVETVDLDVKVGFLHEENARLLLDVQVSNNREAVYLLNENDLELVSINHRAFAPKSEQHPGLVVPPQGKGPLSVTIDVGKYLKEGIWCAPPFEGSWPGPSVDEKTGAEYFRVKVGPAHSLAFPLILPGRANDTPKLTVAKVDATAQGISLTGRIRLNGPPPVRKKIDFSSGYQTDHEGRRYRWPGAELYAEKGLVDESLIVGDNGGVANVFVWVRSKDVPVAPYSGPLPQATLRFKDGRIEPHALAFWNAATLKLMNESNTGSHFKWDGVWNKYNQVLSAGQAIELNNLRPEPAPHLVASSIHPWLSAYVLPLDHPYYAVTGPDGRFEINNLPPGEWEFGVWHELANRLKTDKFPAGRFTLKIEKGKNELGEFLVEPAVFASTLGPETSIASRGFIGQIDPADLPRDSQNLAALLGVIRKALPAGWLAETSGELVDRPSLATTLSYTPVLTIVREKEALAKRVVPNGPAGEVTAKPEPFAITLNFVPYLTVDEFQATEMVNRQFERQRMNFGARLAGIDSAFMGPDPKPPSAFQPKSQDQAEIVRQYAFLWMRTELEALPTHHYRTLAMRVVDDTTLEFEDAAVKAEIGRVRAALDQILKPYGNSSRN